MTRDAVARHRLKNDDKEIISMSPTTIRIISGCIFVILVFIIIMRRKRMAARRKPIP